MSFDNRVFNINGEKENKEGLALALKLAFNQCGNNTKAVGWTISTTHGLILHWYMEEKVTKFISHMTAEECAPMVIRWLDNAEDTIKLTGQWDGDIDHDGSNGRGWRVYVEDWGHIDNFHTGICAILPTFVWYGK